MFYCKEFIMIIAESSIHILDTGICALEGYLGTKALSYVAKLPFKPVQASIFCAGYSLADSLLKPLVNRIPGNYAYIGPIPVSVKSLLLKGASAAVVLLAMKVAAVYFTLSATALIPIMVVSALLTAIQAYNLFTAIQANNLDKNALPYTPVTLEGIKPHIKKLLQVETAKKHLFTIKYEGQNYQVGVLYNPSKEMIPLAPGLLQSYICIVAMGNTPDELIEELRELLPEDCSSMKCNNYNGQDFMKVCFPENIS